MTISRPVIGRLPVNQLDEFACRQLDRVGFFAFSYDLRDLTESCSLRHLPRHQTFPGNSLADTRLL
jgi:hypothetical protein